MADRKGSALATADTTIDMFVYGWIGSSPYKVPASLLVGGTLTFEMFGAVGDGVTDDTAAVQACADMACDLGCSIVPSQFAKYLVTSTIVFKPQRTDGYDESASPPSEIIFDIQGKPPVIDLRHCHIIAGAAMASVFHFVSNPSLTPDALAPFFARVANGHFELGSNATVGILADYCLGMEIDHNVIDGAGTGIKVIGYGVGSVHDNSLRCATGIDLTEGGADAIYWNNDYYTVGNSNQMFALGNAATDQPGQNLFLNNKATNEAQGTNSYFMKVTANVESDIIRNVDVVFNRVAGFNALIYARGKSAAYNLKWWKVIGNNALDYGAKADIGLLDTTETVDWIVESNSFNPMSVDPTLDGIKMVNAARAHINMNAIENAGKAAIRLEFGTKCEVSGNTLHNAGDASTNTKVVILANSSTLCNVHDNLIDQDDGVSFAPIGIAEESSANGNRAAGNIFNNITTKYDVASNASIFGDDRVALLTSSSNATVAAAATVYLGENAQNATEATTVFLVPRAGRVRKLLAKSSAAPGAAQTFTYTLRKNASDTSQTCQTSGAAAVTSEDGTNDIAVAGGDELSVKLVTSAGAAAAYHRVLLELIAD